MGPGPVIAINVILLYIILGPVVLFAIYVLFDSFDRSDIKKKQTGLKKRKDPSLWTREDIEQYFDEK